MPKLIISDQLIYPRKYSPFFKIMEKLLQSVVNWENLIFLVKNGNKNC